MIAANRVDLNEVVPPPVDLPSDDVQTLASNHTGSDVRMTPTFWYQPLASSLDNANGVDIRNTPPADMPPCRTYPFSNCC